MIQILNSITIELHKVSSNIILLNVIKKGLSEKKTLFEQPNFII